MSRYRSLPEVARFQSWSECTLQQAEDLISEMEQSSPAVAGRWFQFGIELTESGTLIGDIGFLNMDEAGKCWVGFTLNSAYWGRGLAAEAVTAVLAYYSEIGISTFWASTEPANTPSRRLLEKLGFALVDDRSDDSIYQKVGWP